MANMKKVLDYMALQYLVPKFQDQIDELKDKSTTIPIDPDPEPTEEGAIWFTND